MIVRTVVWVLAAIFPASDLLPGIGDLPDVHQRVAKMLREAPLSFLFVVYGATLLFLFSPLLTVGWPLPALLLPKAALGRHAYRLAGHRIYLVRQAMLMLKTVGGLIWGGHPDVRNALQMPLYGDDPGTFRAGGESWQELRAAGEQQS